MSIESPESKEENLSEHQREILEATGLESIKALKELLEDLDSDSEEGKYFKQVLEDIESNA